jgi:DNA polymerase delta subunit 1
MERLASVPETFEMARATGLTLNQVLYNAQMIRTWSLLLRSSHRRGFIIAGRMPGEALVESPHLMHPVEHKTVGLYNTPVATLDFASLYPSLYRAYNLCYTTLVHPDDVSKVGAAHCTTTPTGAVFLQPSVRAGILPHILQALMSARASTRAALKSVQKQLQQQQNSTLPPPAAAGGNVGPGHHDNRHAAAELLQHLKARAAVLDGRQKALKVTANALYGFTGAQASPLQCAPLADSCLALGAATCRSAAAAIGEALDHQQLGPKGKGGKVIYAQTDSVFIHFPSATPAEAVELGQAAASLVTQQLPPPIELKYERVLAPFMLLHVNRYAGCSYETAAAAESGTGSLLVKGIKAVWRQSAPLLQNTLMGVLERILMRRDVPGAVSFAEGEIARLLSGRVEVWELAMTGGLWRVTGQQLAAAAAADADEEGTGSQPAAAAASAAAAGAGDDVKGPHASLAVRLSQRDPDKKWLLGERLSYVLLTGARTQDEAAEDPLTVTQLNLTPNYALYWTNKFQIPLQEIFSTCLNPEQMRHLLHGPHTNFRASTTAGSDLPPQQSENCLLLGGFSMLGSQSATGAGGSADNPAASPGRGGGRGRGRGKGGRGNSRTIGVSQAGKKSATSLGSKQRGQGLKMFFQQTAKCLGCKQVIHTKPQHGSESEVEPGLCDDCAKEDGKRESVFISVMHEASDAAERFSAAHSACRFCHSGSQWGGVVCENGECPVAYERLASERLVRTAEHRLLRLDW